MMRCYCLGGLSGKVDSWKAGTSVRRALLRLKTRTFNISLLGLDKSSGYWPTGTQEARASWGKWKLTDRVRGNGTLYERKVKCHCLPCGLLHWSSAPHCQTHRLIRWPLHITVQFGKFHYHPWYPRVTSDRDWMDNNIFSKPNRVNPFDLMTNWVFSVCINFFKKNSVFCHTCFTRFKPPDATLVSLTKS